MKRKKPSVFVSWGSVRLPIYHAPNTVKSKPLQNISEHLFAPPPKLKSYDSYCVAYYENGKRRFLRAPTLKVARQRALALAKRLASEGGDIVHISQAEQRTYVWARNILQKHNLTVDEAARLLDSVLARIDPISLRQAVDFFLAHTRLVHSRATSDPVQEAYLEELERRGAGFYHLRDTKKFLTKFVKEFPGEMIDITTAEIDRWIASFPGKARSKNNVRNAVIGFYNFAQRKDFLPREMDHAAKFLTFFRDPRQTISSEEEALETTARQQVYTPEELARMLSKAPEDVRVTLELKAFSGIRTEELVRLWWVLINEETGAINITEAVAKLDRRTISMPENLRSRLKAYPAEKKQGRICTGWTIANSLYHAWLRIATDANIAYKKNAFRNSFISYRLALTKDINAVAYESGNSPEMIRRYYLDLVTPEAASAWFSL
jgi:broad specificity phosphatase PhoE